MAPALALVLLLAPAPPAHDKVDFRGGPEKRVRLLKHKNPAVRRRAALLLEHAPPDRAIAGVLVALGDRDATVRRAAAQTLNAWHDERATPFLARAVKKERAPRVLRDMLLALGSCGGRYAARRVLPFLDHPSREVRAAAATTLGRLGDPGQRAALWTALRFDPDDQDFVVRSAVLSAFIALGWKEDVKRAVNELEKAGASRHWRARVAIVLAIGAIGWKERSAWLEKVVEQDRDPRVLAAAASSLARLGFRDAVAKWLGHDNALVRRSALEALQDSGDPRAPEAAARMVRADPDVSVRFMAALVLHRSRHPDADVYLVDALRSREASIWITALAELEQKYGQEFGRNPAAWTDFFKRRN
ncbi:MAG: HEAT repeat domain-containing protein [Planctomycetota bacterium]